MKILIGTAIILFLSLTQFIQPATAQMQNTPTINHIALYVYDLEKSAGFYEKIIGLPVIPEPFHDGKHVWFKIGSHSQLHLIKGAAAVNAHDKNSHMCFSVPSVDTFVIQLQKNKINYEDWPGLKSSITLRPDGVKQIYLTDPDGFWIEINDDKY
jgi:lactoylglutathione lyase